MTPRAYRGLLLPHRLARQGQEPRPELQEKIRSMVCQRKVPGAHSSEDLRYETMITLNSIDAYAFFSMFPSDRALQCSSPSLSEAFKLR